MISATIGDFGREHRVARTEGFAREHRAATVTGAAAVAGRSSDSSAPCGAYCQACIGLDLQLPRHQTAPGRYHGYHHADAALDALVECS